MKNEATVQLSPTWEYVSDRVMGGVSNGQVRLYPEDGHEVAQLTGDVSLDNNGGFVQMAFDLRPGGAPFDASRWHGIAFEAKGNREEYEVRLRTTDLSRPWQSFRAAFTAGATWQRHSFLFESFQPHRTDQVFDLKQLKRVGVLAIGRSFVADLSVRGVSMVA